MAKTRQILCLVGFLFLFVLLLLLRAFVYAFCCVVSVESGGFFLFEREKKHEEIWVGGEYLERV